MASGEEIQAALREFAARWQGYSGSEKSEAQTFLNQLFACYGTDRRAVGAEFEFFAPEAGFMDLHWPEVCVIEMKAPAVSVDTAHQQVERYWRASSKPEVDQQAARFVVICNFRELEIWEPGRFPMQPRLRFPLAELPERYDALAFLAGPNVEPNFHEHHRELTKAAASLVADVYHRLTDRRAAPLQTIQRFILQSVWCMFAEDLAMLEGYPFEATARAARRDPAGSAADFLLLFRVLNQKSNHNRRGHLAGTTYVNGQLFEDPADVELTGDELDLLIEAAGFDWTKVDPTIFGSLLEGVLGKEQRWRRGAHYTHEVDIMKIVTPTIVRPWRERIAAVSTPTEARELLDELCSFKVLDPACGCGNFLYLAYRELRRLESELKHRIRTLAADTGLPFPAQPWPYYPLANLQGIDIEPTAVQLTRVTLWMGHRQMTELFGEAEPVLPLQNLPGIQRGDALQLPWPETDCVIGNPPFLGDRLLRRVLGDERVEWLRREFDGHLIDLSGYWFRRAADHLKPGQRAGLVSTNTLRENKHRRYSLDYVAAKGGVITDAVSSQKWPGDARVHVSITNWIHRPKAAPASFILDGVDVPMISTRLRGDDMPEPQTLRDNRGRSFIGCQPTGAGFILDPTDADRMIEADADNGKVVRPYLTGDDLAHEPAQSPTRWIIDFGTMPLEDASRFREPMAIVRRLVRPEREGASRHFERLWWQFAWPRPDMRVAIDGLCRYVASTLVGKRLVFAWAEVKWCPSNLVGVFAFDDDYSMGVLTSRAHGAWAWAQSSTLKGDLRYTPSSAFMTFPWPDPVTDEKRERVADVSRRLLGRRTEICTAEQIGLTTLYNQVDDGAWTDLKALHKELDQAVVACYGWPRSTAQDDRELVRRLAELNKQISDGARAYSPFD